MLCTIPIRLALAQFISVEHLEAEETTIWLKEILKQICTMSKIG